MAKKTKKTNRNESPKIKITKEPVVVYDLIDEKELQEREQKYVQRLNDIRICKKFVEEGRFYFNKIMAENIKDDDWNRYASCDGLPNPDSPQDMRRFIEKTRHIESVDVDQIVDWTLSVDERSILSQDIFRKDLTRKTLINEICPDIGARYNQNIVNYLKTLQMINNLLTNEAKLSLLELTQCAEIVQLENEIKNEIQDTFDRYTYRIVSAGDTYMTTEDGIETNYCLKATNFNMHIWALRDVPLRFEQRDLPLMIVNMPCTGVVIQVPLSCLSHRLTVRCIHTFFDHYTTNAKSYEQIITKPTDHIIAGIPDIEDCLINEWIMQTDIMEEIRENILINHSKYEETLLNIAEQETQAAKARKSKPNNNEKKIKVQKTPTEPQSIPDDHYPDTYKLFLNREQKQFETFLEEFYHPATLNLQPGEINLKKYIILGGTYSIFYVRSPKHLDYQKFHITKHDKNRKLYILSDIVADLAIFESSSDSVDVSETRKNYSSSHATIRDSKHSKHDTRRRTIALQRRILNAQSKLSIAADHEPKDVPTSSNISELPYFFVTFALPRHLCVWGLPVVCQYEEGDEEMADLPEFSDDVISFFDKKSNNFDSKSDVASVNFKTQIFKFVKDGDEAKKDGESLRGHTLTPLPSSSRLHSTMHIAPSNQFNVFRSNISTLLRHGRLPKKSSRNSNLNDFKLNNKLTKNQIRQLERYCLPRIISSFKFSVENNEDLEVQEKGKQISKGNLFMRRAEEVKSHDESMAVYTGFNYEMQENPERVYPIFPKEEFVSYNNNELYNEDPKTMFGLIQTLDIVKENYMTNCKKIINQDVRLHTKKIKERKAVAIDKYSSLDNISRRQTATRKTLHSTKNDLFKFSKEDLQSDDKSLRKIKSIKSDFSTRVKDDANDIADIDSLSLKSRLSTSSYTHKATQEENVQSRKKIMHWTTSHIVKSTLNQQDLTITVQTDRLGIFGLAYKRYEHFPFRFWSLEPNEEKPGELIFTLDTSHVRVIINISNQGFTGYVTDLQTKYVSKPVKYLSINEPITELSDLKELFFQMNVNIFAEHDASYYIENGYFSEKHLATEYHIYNAMSLHCILLKFYHSSWNRLASRRDIILCLRNPKENDDSSTVTVRITPENSTFVEINELCSDDLDEVKLGYTLTWRNISNYTDLHQLINSMYPYATDNRNKDAKIMHYVQSLLNGLRPLSFS